MNQEEGQAMPELKKLHRVPRLDFMVLERHMDEAQKNHSVKCMVAEALKEAYPHFSNVKVDIHYMRFTDAEREERYIVPTPVPVGVVLYKWDEGVRLPEFRVYTRGGGQTARLRKQRPPMTPEDKARLDGLHEKRKREDARIEVERKTQGGGAAYKLGGKVPKIPALNKRTFGIKAFAKMVEEAEKRRQEQETEGQVFPR
jgi:hypothetical protein